MQPADDTVRLRTDDLTWQRASDGIVALDLRADSYLSINASGIVLWELLEHGATRTHMAERLMGDYGLGRDRALADVDEFVAMLRHRGLLA